VNIPVTTEDIDRAVEWMGLQGFDEQRRTILKTTGSVDVQACPGSGKTTVVIAKLAILASKWTERHRGICTLSHTNVAREEIERRVKGGLASKVLAYPHFVGTIQTFVDQFLGIPAAIARFGVRPTIIDSERATEVAFAKLKAQRFAGLRNWLFRGRRSDLVVPSLRFTSLGLSLQVEADGLNIGNATSSYQSLLKLKREMAEQGVFAYDDMFVLANWYLEREPRLKRHLCQRFPIVLIDEMQDTQGVHWSLLSSIFSGGSVIQRFGDTNQAIYSNLNAGDDQASGFPGENVLPMDRSHRFTDGIAKKVANVCPKPHAELCGRKVELDHAPRLFIFAEVNVLKVIPAFAQWTCEKLGKRAAEEPQGVRVVGRVGKPDGKKYSLTHYWPTFSAASQNATRQLPSFVAYLAAARQQLLDSRAIGNGASIILQGMADVLRIGNVLREDGRHYTAATVLPALHKHSSQAHQVAKEWLLRMNRCLLGLEAEDPVALVGVVPKILAPLCPDGIEAEAHEFLATVGSLGDQPVAPIDCSEPNVYYHKMEDFTVPVRVSTIHAAKGQTHLATLVVETFFHDPDLPRLVPYFLGEDPRAVRGRDHDRLKAIYVGLTRPRELLAVAIGSAGIKAEQLDQMAGNGWEVVHVV